MMNAGKFIVLPAAAVFGSLVTGAGADRRVSEPCSGNKHWIEDLRGAKFPGGKIKKTKTLEKNERFTRYLISYLSNRLRITGMA
jgi:hypothetical protein